MGLIRFTLIIVLILLIDSLLLLIIEGFLSILLPFKFEQTLRFGGKNSYLLLHIAIGIHQALKHKDEIVVEFNLVLLEELRYESCLLNCKTPQFLQMILQLRQALTLAVLVTLFSDSGGTLADRLLIDP